MNVMIYSKLNYGEEVKGCTWREKCLNYLIITNDYLKLENIQITDTYVLFTSDMSVNN